MIETINDPEKDVVEERGLFEIVKKSIGVVGQPVDLLIPSILAASSMPIALICELHFHNLAPTSRIAKMLVTWTSLGGTIAATILGFLIAGFAIFAAVTDKLLLAKLASYKSQGRSISQFKFIFFNFMYVFFAYFILVLISIIFTVLAEENSPVWYAAQSLGANCTGSIRVMAFIVTSCYVATLCHCILILRGFIWNLYSALLIAIFADDGVKDYFRNSKAP